MCSLTQVPLPSLITIVGDVTNPASNPADRDFQIGLSATPDAIRLFTHAVVNLHAVAAATCCLN